MAYTVKQKLTTPQAKVLNYLANGGSPAVKEELSTTLDGHSLGSIGSTLNALIRRGLVTADTPGFEIELFRLTRRGARRVERGLF